MRDIVDEFREVWLWIFELPWRHSGPKLDLPIHWVYWSIGWAWALAGLIGGALVAPSLVQAVGLADTPYQDWLVIAIAVVAGFLVQLLGLVLIFLLAIMPGVRGGFTSETPKLLENVTFLAFWGLAVLPLAGVGYGIYRYLSWVGASQRSITVAFVGALLINTFLIPLIKGLVVGTIFKWFMKWLRGKDKPKV